MELKRKPAVLESPHLSNPSNPYQVNDHPLLSNSPNQAPQSTAAPDIYKMPISPIHMIRNDLQFGQNELPLMPYLAPFPREVQIDPNVAIPRIRPVGNTKPKEDPVYIYLGRHAFNWFDLQNLYYRLLNACLILKYPDISNRGQFLDFLDLQSSSSENRKEKFKVEHPKLYEALDDFSMTFRGSVYTVDKGMDLEAVRAELNDPFYDVFWKIRQEKGAILRGSHPELLINPDLVAKEDIPVELTNLADVLLDLTILMEYRILGQTQKIFLLDFMAPIVDNTECEFAEILTPLKSYLALKKDDIIGYIIKKNRYEETLKRMMYAELAQIKFNIADGFRNTDWYIKHPEFDRNYPRYRSGYDYLGKDDRSLTECQKKAEFEAHRDRVNARFDELIRKYIIGTDENPGVFQQAYYEKDPARRKELIGELNNNLEKFAGEYTYKVGDKTYPIGGIPFGIILVVAIRMHSRRMNEEYNSDVRLIWDY